MRKRKRKFVETTEAKSNGDDLREQIKNAVEGLYYISETDAEFEPFFGARAKSVSKEEILRQTNTSPDVSIEEKDFAETFERLTKIQDWYGEEENEAAAKFAALRDLLEKHLTGLKIFKIGKIEIDIYFVGLDAGGILTGVKTKAVET